MGKYRIVYFSGTGCTALVANCLEKILRERGCETAKERIAAGSGCAFSPFDPLDTLILLYPLHAFNAPGPVVDWIRNLNGADGAKAVVISVSGGGDICPNTAGRVGVIKMLKRKGCDVFYEGSLVMQSNISIATPEPLSIMLLRVLPDKVSEIAAGVLSGERKRESPPVIDRFFSMAGKAERRAAKSWGKSTKVSSDCYGCGLCAELCPTGNIKMADSKPEFSKKCCMCLGCFYACPKGALKPKIAKSMILKNFNLKDLEQKSLASELEDVKAAAMEFRAGYLFSGVKKYLTGGQEWK